MLKQLVLCAVVGAMAAGPVIADSQLTGDPALACQAILCLSTGTRPNECSPSLARYFSISYRYFSDTIRGRINFLKLCPASDQTPEMQSLVNAMANGAGQCDATSLNSTNQIYSQNDGSWDYVGISDVMPDYCHAYTQNSYVDSASLMPRYVGASPSGRWVEAAQYNQALADYTAAQQAAQQQDPYNY